MSPQVQGMAKGQLCGKVDDVWMGELAVHTHTYYMPHGVRQSQLYKEKMMGSKPETCTAHIAISKYLKSDTGFPGHYVY